MTIAQFLKPLEVADILGLSRTQIYDLIREQKIASHRFGSSVRLTEADVEAYIASTRQEMKAPRRAGRAA